MIELPGANVRRATPDEEPVPLDQEVVSQARIRGIRGMDERVMKLPCVLGLTLVVFSLRFDRSGSACQRDDQRPFPGGERTMANNVSHDRSCRGHTKLRTTTAVASVLA